MPTKLTFSKSMINDFIDPEVFNFLSRVPTRRELFRYKELKLKT